MAASRIRFYESMGLIEPARRRAGGHREYAMETLSRLEKIMSAQQAGCTLEEIGVMLASGGGESRGALRRALKRKIAGIETLQRRLADEHEKLSAALRRLRAEGQDCQSS